MKKIIIIILLVAVALMFFYLIGTGFMQRYDVALGEYFVSEDGTELTFRAGAVSSMGYIRNYKDEGGGVKPHYIKFYSAFGGFNGSWGAKSEFVLPLGKDDTQIYFSRPDGGYELVLQKSEETGLWERAYPAENHEYKTLKIIDGAENGKLILAGAESGNVYTLDAADIEILINGKKAELKDLEDGMPIDVYYESDFDNVQKPMDAVMDITSFCKSINGYTIGTERNPGGSYYDLSGLYLKVLEDLWKVDAGLNGDIKYISIDLSKAPGKLTEGEKSAISYIFAKAHDAQCLQLTFDELREQGYIEKDELYWKDGLLFSITDDMKAEEQYSGLRVIKFDAQKWRSGTGAYFFTDCSASWSQMGTWLDYNVGGHAIS